MNDPYEMNDDYRVLTYVNKEKWREGRKKGIGGSDAAAALGISKWMTNVDLWKIKTGRLVQKDLSDNPFVIYGTNAEEPLRRLYELDNELKYRLYYRADTIIESRADEFMRYSPDALLVEKESGRLGIWENKTTTIYRNTGNLWKTEIPQEYYVQILHGLNTIPTAQFVELQVQIKRMDFIERRVFHIERSEVTGDLEYELDGIRDFMEYVKNDIEPPLMVKI